MMYFLFYLARRKPRGFGLRCLWDNVQIYEFLDETHGNNTHES